MNKKILIVIGIAIIAIVGILFLTTGKTRTDVYLKDYEVSEDGKTMTLKVGVSDSTGYVRKIKRTSGSMNYYFTFYSTFGINSKLGAKDTFEIAFDSNVDEIYFYTGDKGYKKVLEKDEVTGEWKLYPQITSEEQTKMIQVNGKLYINNGEESTVTARCGNMDGQITTNVEQDEIPTIDNQSNFTGYYEYQYGAENTIEVKVDDKWFVFRLKNVEV